jgi:hypothetical protein
LWIAGGGYSYPLDRPVWASVSNCRGMQTVILHRTEAEASKAGELIDKDACGGCCQGAHYVVRLDPLVHTN